MKPTEKTPNFDTEKYREFMRKTYYGNADSDAAIAEICKKYNLSDKSDAIRIALHLVATSALAQLPVPVQPAPKRGRPRIEK